jgi:hypothetical protein
LFVEQINRAHETGLMPLLQEEMASTMTLTQGEINGMYFDKRGAMTEYEGSMADDIASYDRELVELFAKAGVPEMAVHPASNPFISTLLYGGEYKYEYRQPLVDDDGNAVVFKSGKKRGLPRNKLIKEVWTSPPTTRAVASSVDAEALVVIKDHDSTTPAVAEALDVMLKWRKLKKQASTYFVGYSKLTWPHDSHIHGNMNQAVAATGRLSSSAPNLQNAAHGPIRKHFTSRVPGGRLMEADLSQIEVIVQAILSQDKAMLGDLHKGVDFHSKRAALAAGVEYEVVLDAVANHDIGWMKKRKDAKIFSFQRAYGAGPATIALGTGMKYKDVMKLIKAEEQEYPGVVEMNAANEVLVAKSAVRVGDDTLGQLVSATGARYVFKREIYKNKATFKPTMIKNYPIQGLAGDIIKLILARLRRVVWRWNDVFNNRLWFINSVHDSLVFDIGRLTDSEAVEFAQSVHYMMTTQVEEALLRKYDLDFEGLIKADVDVGHNWYGYDKESNPHGMRALKL